MTEITRRSVIHDTVVLIREYPHPRARVFDAFVNPESKSGWYLGVDERSIVLDIVENERIVFISETHVDDAKVSAALTTIEFVGTERGTAIRFTEQGAFLDALADPAARETAVEQLHNQLGVWLDAN